MPIKDSELNEIPLPTNSSTASITTRSNSRLRGRPFFVATESGPLTSLTIHICSVTVRSMLRTHLRNIFVSLLFVIHTVTELLDWIDVQIYELLHETVCAICKTYL